MIHHSRPHVSEQNLNIVGPVLLHCPHQARQPVRPLDVLCEAKISAASPTFIKCSCEACTGGAAGYAGGNFNSVRDFLAHGQAVFGPETIAVLAELEMSWQVSWQQHGHRLGQTAGACAAAAAVMPVSRVAAALGQG